MGSGNEEKRRLSSSSIRLSPEISSSLLQFSLSSIRTEILAKITRDRRFPPISKEEEDEEEEEEFETEQTGGFLLLICFLLLMIFFFLELVSSRVSFI